MTNGDSTTMDIYLLERDAQSFHGVNSLAGERLVDLEKADVFLR